MDILVPLIFTDIFATTVTTKKKQKILTNIFIKQLFTPLTLDLIADIKIKTMGDLFFGISVVVHLSFTHIFATSDTTTYFQKIPSDTFMKKLFSHEL